MATVKNPNRIRLPFSTKLFNAVGFVVALAGATACIIPFLFIIAGSFTDEQSIIREGFSLIPRQFSIEAYKMAFENPQSILNAYGITISLAVLGTTMGLLLTTMTAYVLYRPDFKYRNFFSFMFYFTTIFSGGLVASYLWITNYLKINDTYLVLLYPGLLSSWNIIVMRSFMRSIPFEIVESAKIDGANDFRIFVQIMLPLSTPGLATVGLFIALSYWNAWYNAMLYVNNVFLFPLQYYLYRMVNSLQYLRQMIAMGATQIEFADMPAESLKMAMAVIVTGPAVIFYPFVQKYIIKGLTIGSVKG